MMGIKRRITGTDIADLRDMLGISLLDMLWLTGSFVPKWKLKKPTLNKAKIETLEQEINTLKKEIHLLKKTPDDAEHETEKRIREISDLIDDKQLAVFQEEEVHKNTIHSPALSIMTRLLIEYPSLNIVPLYPSPKEIYDLIDAYYPHNDPEYGQLNTRRFSQIIGISDWAGYNWLEQEKNVNPTHKRLFIMLKTLIEGNDYIEGQGTEGLKKYISIVEEELKSRGITEGIKELSKEGGWKGKDLNQQAVIKRKLSELKQKEREIEKEDKEELEELLS